MDSLRIAIQVHIQSCLGEILAAALLIDSDDTSLLDMNKAKRKLLWIRSGLKGLLDNLEIGQDSLEFARMLLLIPFEPTRELVRRF